MQPVLIHISRTVFSRAELAAETCLLTMYAVVYHIRTYIYCMYTEHGLRGSADASHCDVGVCTYLVRERALMD
jgi:hypothetical protein